MELNPVLIGIAGGTGSGKSTLAENIHDIGHIQFADCPGRHEPDSAQIPFADIFKWLEHSDYQGYVAAEYRPRTNSSHSFAWKDKYFPN